MRRFGSRGSMADERERESGKMEKMRGKRNEPRNSDLYRGRNT